MLRNYFLTVILKLSLSGCLYLRPFLSAYAAQNGCNLHGNLLVCQGRLPRRNELDDTIETMIVGQVMQGQWLSVGDWVNVDGRITQMQLRHVRINRIDPGYFAAVSGRNSLRKLTLNAVTGEFSVDQNVLSGLTDSLSQLVVIGETHVNLTDVAKLKRLADLELRNTITSYMPENFLQSLPNLRSVELANTSLSTLPWDTVVKWLGEDRTRSIKLVNFRLHCDCDKFALKNLAIGPISTALESLTCATPPTFQGMLLRDFSQDELCPATTSSTDYYETTSDLFLAGGRSVKAKGVRTEVIIAVSIVATIVMVGLIGIVIYKVRFSSRMKAKQMMMANGQTLHQSHRYCAVIEKPLPEAEIGRNHNGVNSEQSINSALLGQKTKYCGQEV